MIQFGMEMTFGDWLKLRRRQLDLTQKALAYKVGCGLGTLRKLENGSRRPSKALAVHIGKVLQVPEAEMPVFVRFARSDPEPIQLPSFAQEQITPPQVEIPKPEPPYVLPPPHNLPFSLTRIIGRDGEIAELTHLLLHSSKRLVTLIGLGGIGKTRLATAVAHAILAGPAHPFPDGIFFVSLAAFNNVEQVVLAVAQQLNFQFEPGSRLPQQQLLYYLKPKKMLLVMDNFEQIKEGFQLLLDILQEAPDTKILVTSRESLALQGEQNYLLGGLTYPNQLSDSVKITEYGAPALFIERAMELRPDFHLDDNKATDLLELCRLLDGMPLALIIAARWVEVLSLAEIVIEVNRSFDLLETSVRDLPTRHQSIKAVFDSTWNFLSESERQIYLALSIFRDGFTLKAAREVTGARPHDLKELMGHALLTRGEDGRFQLHELLRQFAAQELAQDSDRETAARSQHSSYYCQFLAAREPNLKNEEAIKTAAEIGRDYENIRVAWHWAAENGEELLLRQTAPALGVYHLRQGESQEGVPIFRAAWESVSAFRNLSDLTQALLLAWLGLLLGRTALLAEMQEGEKFAREALTKIEQAANRGENVRVLQALTLLALGCTTSGTQEAIEFFEAALELYSELGMKWEKAYTLRRVVGGYSRLGNRNRVLEYNLEAQRLFENVGDKVNSNYLKLLVGNNLYKILRQVEKGEATMRESLAWFQENDPSQLLASGWNIFMDFLVYAGRYQEAISIHDEAQSGYESWSNSSMRLLHNSALWHLGHYEAVQEEALSRLEITQKRHSESGNGYYKMHLGFIELLHGEVETARSYLNEALETIKKQEGVGWTWAGFGYLALLESDVESAADHLAKALRIATTHKLAWTALFAFPLAASLLTELGQIERAIELFELARTYDFVANSQLFYDLTGRKLDALAAALPPEVVAAAKERGRSLDFWETANALLLELNAD